MKKSSVALPNQGRHLRRALTTAVLVSLIALNPSVGRANSQASLECRLTLNDGPVSAEPGVVYRQDFYIDTATCTFIASGVRQLEGAELDRLRTLEGGFSKQILASKRASSTSTGSRFASPLFSGPLTVYNRHSTWDCCALETTYVDHQQTFSWDGTNSSVSQIGTTAWWRVGTGWYLVYGPNQQFNTSNPASSVSSTGSASFNNTTFPCPDGSCQPCDHTLYSEVRSYGTGAWTRSSSYIGHLCNGWIHTDSTWGTR